MAKVKRGFNFSDMEVKKPNYSKFNLSHDKLCALGAGKLVPLWWTEGIPGDIWNVSISAFARLLALSSPMLQREDIFIRGFKIPERILVNQDDLDKFYCGDKEGDHLDMPFVHLDPSNMQVGSLYDYLDLPLPYKWNSLTKSWDYDADNAVNIPDVSIMPFLAYQRVYHDHFRNEETEDEYLDMFKLHFSDLDNLNSSDDVGVTNSPALDKLQDVCWERDYFTSALANSQRGSQVSIPLLGSANVVPATSNSTPIFKDSQGADFVTGDTVDVSLVPGSENKKVHLSNHDSENPLSWVATGLKVDGSSFTGIGAIALRMAMNLQAFMERNNIAGYRMIGNILAHFGVFSSNRLMDEVEYLGGIKAPITISAVNQTSATQSNSTPQGTQVGTAQSAFSGHLFRTFCEEPCILMVVAYINAKSSYSQGLARKWTRRSYLDKFWPEFQTVGEQEILNQEVFFDYYSNLDKNKETWAYQSRYSEYKYEPDAISGDFRTTLSYWHQSRLFTSLPAFNDNFVKSNPSDRVFALDSATYPRPYLGEFYFDAQVVRPMDKYAQSKLW